MAYYSDQNMNEDEQQLQQQPVLSGQSSAIGGGQAASKPTKGDNPGNFVGIKQFLDANKNQANKFGSQVAGKVTGAIDKANQNLGGFQQQFAQEASQGNYFQDANQERQAAESALNKAAQGQQLGQDEAQKFTQAATAQYKGPQSVETAKTFNPVYQTVQEAQDLANMSKTEQGAQDLSRSLVDKNKQYTRGANRLDSYLLNTQENRNKLLDARRGAEALNPALEEQKKEAAKTLESQKSQADQLRSQVQDLFSKTSMSKKAQVDEALKQRERDLLNANNYRQALINKLQDTSDAGSVALNQKEMQDLGLQEGESLWGALYGDIGKAFSGADTFDPNKAITKEEQAQLAALQDLGQGAGLEFMNPYVNSEVAGTQNMGKIDPTVLRGMIEQNKQKAMKDFAENKNRGMNVAKDEDFQAWNQAGTFGQRLDLDGTIQDGVFGGLKPAHTASLDYIEKNYLPRISQERKKVSEELKQLKSMPRNASIDKRIRELDVSNKLYSNMEKSFDKQKQSWEKYHKKGDKVVKKEK